MKTDMAKEHNWKRQELPLGDVREPIAISAKERDDARFMGLDGVPSSPVAEQFAASIAWGLYSESTGGRGAKPGKAYVAAVGALLSDLLRNANPDPTCWGFCSHRREAFSGQRIGYRVFKAAFKAMEREGLLTKVPGHQQHLNMGGRRIRSWAKSTRARGTERLLRLVEGAGITPATHDDHFHTIERVAPQVLKDPLECRKGSLRFGATKFTGDVVPLDPSDPEAMRLLDQMNRLNEFFARQDIGGQVHRGFRRVFNEADAPDFAWNKGGRLVSVGGGYQHAKAAERAKMTLNGEGVAEIDITASHLTILHALRGMPFDPSTDPYSIDQLPRGLVKDWVTMTLGHSKLHSRWPASVAKRHEAELGHPLNTVYPLKKTQEAILRRLPLLSDWAASPVRWADLQFAESCAIIRTMEALAFEHGLACLPVHDSIIVPASKAALGADTLSDAFRSVVGVSPHLKGP
jgi:hypothetical protein